MTKASIQAVAKEAGVSVSTVSRTFAKPDLVLPETRDKVMAAAEKLDYSISRSAAAETGGSTTTWVMNNHDVPRSPSRYGLPQPSWFKDYAVDVEQADSDSMLALYHAALAIRQESLTATRDTTAEQVDMGPDVVAYTRAAVGGRTFTSITNFGTEPVELPGGSVVLTSGPMTPDGQLPTDTSAWVIK